VHGYGPPVHLSINALLGEVKKNFERGVSEEKGTKTVPKFFF